MRPDLHELLQQMTLAEKVSMLAGADMWHTVAIERLGIPALKVSDGPNGARGGGSFTDSRKAACFPAGISLAATWNTDLVERIGQALGQETKTKGAHVLLAPTTNMFRSPLNGRNFESFSEDPYLASRMTVAYITGVQSQGVGTSVKHYICNDSEFERNTINSQVGERALREIYLPPFQAAIREAGAWTIMAAYNNINGMPATENVYLLHEILRKEWGYDGVTVSDWFAAVKTTAASVNAGLDLEMPGPPLWRGELLLQAVERGEVAEATLDESVSRLLHLLVKAGVFEQEPTDAEQALDLPEHRALIRAAGAEGIVLLKNEPQVLPLQHEHLTSLAIIGPNAKVARAMGGGSAHVNAHYLVTPFDGIVASVGDSVKIGYELGCTNHKSLPLLDSDLILAGREGKEHGLSVEYFNDQDFSGAPVFQELRTSSEIQWFDLPSSDINTGELLARISARFTPVETGTYSFGLTSAGLSRFFIDGQEVIDNWTHQNIGASYFGMGTDEVRASVELEAGRAYQLVLEFRSSEQPLRAVRLGMLAPVPGDAIERAVSLAAASDVALVFVGLNDEWESEGADRADIELVGEQNLLVERVAAVNKNTVVILNTGSPVALPWLEKVASVIQAWYPGQECGNAIADVLFGKTTPSGKLSQTFPLRVEDNPAYLNYPGENGNVVYGEGLFIGYRYYEKKKIAPLFPFGFGLSYTTFAYSPLRLSSTKLSSDETLHVSFELHNTGQFTGKEVVQLYVRDEQSRLHRPEKELKAFAKVELAPGESKTVTLSLGREALAYFDDAIHEWIAEPGIFEVLVGASSQDIRSTATFELASESRWLV